MNIEQLLYKTVSDGASDLHLTVGAPPCYRVHGEMTPIADQQLTESVLHEMLMTVLTAEQQQYFERQQDIDLSLEIKDLARFRVNMFVGRQGAGAVLRVIPTRIKTAEELGLPPVIADLSKIDKGLVLVTGPTGSGKSTTLAAIVDLINEQRRGHILTIEDPIEFVHPHKGCIVNQREVKSNTESFSSALRAALREDPDVILVGEMRDLETIQLAISAAETGHLVLGTLHTSSAPQTIDRVIDVFPPHQQQQVRTMLSESLQAVVAQQLLPKVGGGRVASHEIMLATTAIRNLIREGKSFQIPSVIETNTNLGMQTSQQSVLALVRRGQVSYESALEKGVEPQFALEASQAAPHIAPAQPRHAEPSAPIPAAIPPALPAATPVPTPSLGTLDVDEGDDDGFDLQPLVRKAA